MEREDIKILVNEGIFTKANNMSFVSYEDEVLILKMLPDERHISELNILHGGIIYTFADTVTGILCMTLGKVYVTIDATMNYISNTPKGVEIFGRAYFVHKGNTICVVDVQVYTKEKLLTKGTFTYHSYLKKDNNYTAYLEKDKI